MNQKLFQIKKNSKIFVAGHKGLIGSAFIRRFNADKYSNIITATREVLELTDQNAVDEFFSKNNPEVVIMAAGKVGGIIENRDYPTDFIQQNLAIQYNVFSAAQKFKVKKLLFFGSSCMYPKVTEQPMKEGQLCTGHPEQTSIAYATAKYAGIQMCQAINQQNGEANFIPVIPNSAYGPNDNFDPKSSHVLAALIQKFHKAKENNDSMVTLWGTGEPRREFIYADDIADACLLLLNSKLSTDDLPINIGVGSDISIKELAEKIKQLVGFSGEIAWDKSKPNGALRKLLDNTKIREFGWDKNRSLDLGLKETYQWYLRREYAEH